MTCSRKMIFRALAGVTACLALAFPGSRPAAAGNGWRHNVGLGLNLNRGNTDSTHTSAILDGKRGWASQSLLYAVSGSYGRTDGKASRERLSARTEFSRDLAERLFWSASTAGETDRVGGIDYLFDAGAGVGYYLLRDDRKSLSIQPGAAWVARRYRDADKEDYPAFQLVQKFEYRPSEKSRAWQSARYLPRVDQSWGDFLLNFESGLSAPLGGSSSLRLVLENLYHARPSAGKSRNNLSLTAYLAWKI